MSFLKPLKSWPHFWVSNYVDNEYEETLSEVKALYSYIVEIFEYEKASIDQGTRKKDWSETY